MCIILRLFLEKWLKIVRIVVAFVYPIFENPFVIIALRKCFDCLLQESDGSAAQNENNAKDKQQSVFSASAHT